MTNLIFIAVFGILGIFCRYGIDLWLIRPSDSFPLSTFLINILGAALAGAIFAWSEGRTMGTEWQAGLLVGFCGGFTTFSAYAVQSAHLLERGQSWLAISYFVLSPLLGLGAAVVSIICTRRFLV